MLNRKIAQQIAEKTSKICKHNIVIIDSAGVIIASDDRKRIDTHHGGLESVMKNRQILINSEEEAKEFGAYGGIALPIIVNDQVLGAVGITGNPEEVFRYGELVRSQVEMMYQQALFFEHAKMKSEMFDVFLQELLTLNDYKKQDVNHLKTLGRILGYDLNIPRIAIVISLSINETLNKQAQIDEEVYFSLKSKVLKAVERFFNDKESIIAKMDNNRYIILKSLGTKNEDRDEIITSAKKVQAHIVQEYKTTSLIGIGSYYPELLDLKDSFKDAEQVLTIARKMGSTQGVFSIDDLQTGRILNEVSESTRKYILNSPRINELFTSRNKWLIHTIAVFFENDLNLSESAKSLVIHRNTLIYRLSKVESITGLNPRNFEQALTLFLICKLNDFNV